MNKPISIATLVELLSGAFHGDDQQMIHAPAKIELAKMGEISFVANSKYIPHIKNCEASAILISKSIASQLSSDKMIVVEDAYSAFAKVLHYFDDSKIKQIGISESAIIDNTAVVSTSAFIGSNCVLSANCEIGSNSQIKAQVYIGEKVKIGSNCIIYPGVNIYNDTIIGDNCIIHSGVVIGADGFGFAPVDGKYQKIPQLGNVVIENNVEIGANCTIDRATLGSTMIREGVKLDNLIMIGHNVEIGAHTVIAAQSGVSGSTILGNNCIVGGQVGFAGHLNIAPNTMINGQSGVNSSIADEGGKWFGSPAIKYGNYLRSYSVFKNLETLQQRINKLEEMLSLTDKKSKNA